jgi:hypothetical protein
MTKGIIDELKDARKAIDSALEKLEGTKKEPKQLKSIISLGFHQTTGLNKEGRIAFDCTTGEHEISNGIILFPERMKHSIRVSLDYQLIQREIEVYIQLFDETNNHYISTPYCLNPQADYRKLLEGLGVNRIYDHLSYNFITSDIPKILSVKVLRGEDNLLMVSKTSYAMLESISTI